LCVNSNKFCYTNKKQQQEDRKIIEFSLIVKKNNEN